MFINIGTLVLASASLAFFIGAIALFNQREKSELHDEVYWFFVYAWLYSLVLLSVISVVYAFIGVRQ